MVCNSIRTYCYNKNEKIILKTLQIYLNIISQYPKEINTTMKSIKLDSIISYFQSNNEEIILKILEILVLFISVKESDISSINWTRSKKKSLESKYMTIIENNEKIFLESLSSLLNLENSLVSEKIYCFYSHLAQYESWKHLFLCPIINNIFSKIKEDTIIGHYCNQILKYLTPHNNIGSISDICYGNIKIFKYWYYLNWCLKTQEYLFESTSNLLYLNCSCECNKIIETKKSDDDSLDILIPQIKFPKQLKYTNIEVHSSLEEKIRKISNFLFINTELYDRIEYIPINNCKLILKTSFIIQH